MEVKSRKKSNLYDSIKKDNRCEALLCKEHPCPKYAVLQSLSPQNTLKHL